MELSPDRKLLPITPMLLTPPEAELFFKLHKSLMFFVNQQLHVLPNIDSIKKYSRLRPNARMKVHRAFLDEIDLIEKFIDENPFAFSDDELDVVHSWHHLESGQFLIFRELKKYTVFLSIEKRPIAYGVLALTEPFEDLVGPYLPVLTETTLLPFRDKIIYDGLLNSFNLSFGGEYRRSFKDNYNSAKRRWGIVTTLPAVEARPAVTKHAASKPSKHQKRGQASSRRGIKRGRVAL